jgi:MFS transporter, DHA1 family, tetracycline resistance protein
MRRSPLAVLTGAVLVDMIGFGIVLPLLPFYAESMGATPLEVTLLIASFSAMQLAAAPLWGRVSDRTGRRPLLIAGLFASAVSHLIFGLATSLPLLFVSRMAAGAAGGTITLAHAYVADSTGPRERAQALGWIGAAAGLGVMLGPAIGGFFSRWGLGMPGFVAAALCTGNAIAAIALLPESRQRDARLGARQGEAATLRGWARAMVRYPLSLLLLVYFLSISSFTAMTAVLALYLERTFGLGADAMGYVLALSGGATFVVRGVLLGPLVARLGERRTVFAGTIGLALGIIMVPLVPNPWWLGVAAPLWAFGAGTLFPSLASLTSQATDRHSQGAILGGSQVVGGLGRVVGPLWAGLLFQTVAFTTPFHTATVLVGVAALLALRIPATLRSDDAEAAEAGIEGAEPSPGLPSLRERPGPAERG